MARRRSNRVREYELERDLATAAPVAPVAPAEAKFVSNPNKFYGRMGEGFEKWLRNVRDVPEQITGPMSAL